MIRLLAIGNSYSWNATDYLPEFAAAQGHQITLGHASNGGWSLEKHWTHVEMDEAGDPTGKPYKLDGRPAGLKEMLHSSPWDIVTFQQHSWSAIDLNTYQPFATQLTNFVRQHVPKAQLWMHETWAYRVGGPILLKHNLTQEQMYRQIHHACRVVSKQVNADKLIPTATAFQNVRQDPRWRLEVEDFDPATLKYPNLLKQKHALCIGHQWDAKVSPPRLDFDPKHCTPEGRYLGTVVWYHSLFGEARREPFVPKAVSAADAAILRDVGRRTVLEGLKPAMPALA